MITLATKLFELLGTITVNNSDANTKIDETGEKVNDFHGKFQDSIQKASNWALGIAAAAATAAAGVLKGVSNIVKNTLSTGDEIDKASQRLGMSAQAYQEWKYVLGQSGMEISSLEMGMKTLRTQMDAAADPNSDAAKTFKQLGVSVRDAEGNLRSAEDVFKELVMAMTAMEDNTDKELIAQTLFGRSGTDMLPMLKDTTENIVGLIDQAHALDLIMSDESVKAAVNLGDTIDATGQAYATFGRDIGIAAMPALQDFYNYLLDIYPDLKEKFNELLPTIQGVFQGLVDALKWCIENKDTVVTAIGAIATVFATVKVSKSVLEFMNLAKNAKELFTSGGGGNVQTPNVQPTTSDSPSGGGGIGQGIGTSLGGGAAGKIAGKALGKGASGTGTATATGTGTASVGGGFLNFMSALTPLAVTAAAILPAILEENRLTAERIEKNTEYAAAAAAVSEYGTNNPEILRLGRIVGDYWENEDKRSFADESEAIRKLFGYDDGREGYDPAKMGKMNNALRMYGFEGNSFTGENMDLVDVEMWLDSVGEMLKQMQEANQNQIITGNVVLDSGAIVGYLSPVIDQKMGQIVAMKARG